MTNTMTASINTPSIASLFFLNLYPMSSHELYSDNGFLFFFLNIIIPYDAKSMRGSTTAQIKSTIKLMTPTMMVTKMITPITTGTSLLFTAFTSITPIPGTAKMFSVTMAPPIPPAKLIPICVMTGIKLFLIAWWYKTFFSSAPLARRPELMQEALPRRYSHSPEDYAPLLRMQFPREYLHLLQTIRRV